MAEMMKTPENLELFYLICGVGAGAMSSFAKSLKNTKVFTKTGIIKMVADSISCAILTLGISLSMHEYFEISLIYSIGIGAFIGNVGNTVVVELFSSIFSTFAERWSKEEKNDK